MINRVTMVYNLFEIVNLLQCMVRAVALVYCSITSPDCETWIKYHNYKPPNQYRL